MTTTVRIRIIGDASSLKKATREAGDAMGQLEKVGGGVGGKLAAALSVAAVGKFAADSVKLASGVQESFSKLSVLVGSSAETMMSWSKTTARSIGVSQSAALEAAGTFANLFNGLHKTQPETAAMSKKMVELAADMASFNNASIEDALVAINAGLRGEALPLRRFGVLLDDATLKQRALNEGLVKSATGVLPPNIRLQAAYAEILAQTTKQQGDYARTSHLLANQTRTLQAEFTDMKTELGAGLYPVAMNVVGGLRGAIPVFRELGKQAMGLGSSMGVSAEGLMRAASSLGTFAVGAAAFQKTAGFAVSAKDSIIGMATAAGTLGGAATLVGTALAGLAAYGFVQAARDAADTKTAADALTAALRAQGDPTQILADRMERLAKNIKDVGDNSTDAEGKKIPLDATWAENIAISKDALDEFNNVLGVNSVKLRELVGDGAAVREFIRLFSDMGIASGELGVAATETDKLGAAFDNATPAQKEFLLGLIDARNSGALDKDAYEQVINTLDTMSRALRKNADEMAGNAKVTVQRAINAGLLTKSEADLALATQDGRTENEKWVAIAALYVDKLEELDGKTKDTAGATQTFSSHQVDSKKAVEDLTDAIDKQTKAHNDQREALMNSFNKELAYERQEVRLAEAMDELAAATKERDDLLVDGVATTDAAREAQKNFEAKLLDTKDAALDMAAAAEAIAVENAKVSGSADPAAAGTQAFRDKLADLRKVATDPAMIAFFDNMITKMDAQAAAAKEAAERLAWLRDQVGKFGEAQVAANLAELGLTPERATGGPVAAGQTYLVGEKGPELFRSRTAGTIVPNDQLASMPVAGVAGDAGGQTYIVNVYSPIGRPGDVARWLREELRKLDRGSR